MRALASHRWCGPGSNTGVDAIFGLSWRLLLVLSPAPRGFSASTPVSPSHQKSTLPNSNSTRNRVDEEPLCRCATSKSLSIYFIHLKVNLLIDNLIKDFLCKLLHKKHPVFIPQLLEIVPPVGDLRGFPLAYRSVGSSTRTYKDCIKLLVEGTPMADFSLVDLQHVLLSARSAYDRGWTTKPDWKS